MKIAVIGSGYVGMSLAVLLSQNNSVTIYDIDSRKVELINDKKSPIKDKEIQEYLKKDLSLNATLDYEEAFKNADFIIIATPTDYDHSKNFFDTSSVDLSVKIARSCNKDSLIIIKSTIPIGYTQKLRKEYNTDLITFSPEFLREGKALHDNLYPSRIIIGSDDKLSKKFVNLLLDSSLEQSDQVPILYSSSSEAESIKLFSNTYLAMRVSFFNELDTFALKNGLNTENIIRGCSFDKRIGEGYNNPSFGYGGYCLPKDTQQLLASYKDVPQNLIEAIVNSNETRKNFLVQSIIEKNPSTVGFFNLAMKKGSDNYRSSAIIDLIFKIQSKGCRVIVFEKDLEIDNNKSFNFEVCGDLKIFKESSDIIVTNRMSSDLEDVISKVFTRDIFNVD